MRQQLIDHVRTNGSPLASAERRALIHMAQRLPGWVTPDHLSGLGLAAMAGAGLSFWAAQYWMVGLVGVVLSLALNWFGDSLDGTLARVRKQERPRFGFYVDHVIDLAGATMLFCGLGASGFMSPLVALGVLSAYLLVSAEVFLATHVRGVFKMTFLGVGPTELRILLAVGVAALAWRPMVSPFGLGPFRLFDVGGVVAIAGMGVAFIVSSIRNTRALFDAERVSRIAAVALVVLTGGAGAASAGTPSKATVAAFNRYVDATHTRIQAEREPADAAAARRIAGHGRVGDGGAVARRLDRRARRARQPLARPHVHPARRPGDRARARPAGRDAAAPARRRDGPHRPAGAGPRSGAAGDHAVAGADRALRHRTRRPLHAARAGACRQRQRRDADPRGRREGRSRRRARIAASCGRCGRGGATKRCPAACSSNASRSASAGRCRTWSGPSSVRW